MDGAVTATREGGMMLRTNVSRRRVVPPALGAACRGCPERAGRGIGDQLLERFPLACSPSRVVAFDRSCGGADYRPPELEYQQEGPDEPF
jgi:hypothetical protein